MGPGGLRARPLGLTPGVALMGRLACATRPLHYPLGLAHSWCVPRMAGAACVWAPLHLATFASVCYIWASGWHNCGRCCWAPSTSLPPWNRSPYCSSPPFSCHTQGIFCRLILIRRFGKSRCWIIDKGVPLSFIRNCCLLGRVGQKTLKWQAEFSLSRLWHIFIWLKQ